MLALVLSDVHSRLENLKKITNLIHNRNVGLALVLGDLTNLGGKKEAAEVLDLLEGLEVLAIPGNFDTEEVKNALEEKGVSLHNKKKKIGKWVFAGFGGGLAGRPGRVLHSEPEIKKSLLKLASNEKKLVLLTHLPPFGTSLDLSYSGTHIGSRSVRQALEEKQPALHLCGHCHEAAGEEIIGKTTSVNVGAVKEGKALLLEIGDVLKWERISL